MVSVRFSPSFRALWEVLCGSLTVPSELVGKEARECPIQAGALCRPTSKKTPLETKFPSPSHLFSHPRPRDKLADPPKEILSADFILLVSVPPALASYIHDTPAPSASFSASGYPRKAPVWHFQSSVWLCSCLPCELSCSRFAG